MSAREPLAQALAAADDAAFSAALDFAAVHHNFVTLPNDVDDDRLKAVFVGREAARGELVAAVSAQIEALNALEDYDDTQVSHN